MEAAVSPGEVRRPSWWSRQRARWRMSFGHTATTADEVELVQRRIYLLPSARGLFVILTAVLLLLVGINYQLSLAFVVAFLLAGLMQVMFADWVSGKFVFNGAMCRSYVLPP